MAHRYRPTVNAAVSADFKQAAVRQWTADPCEARSAEGEPGSAGYFRALLAARDDYGPWIAEALDYDGSSGLEVLDVGCGQGIDLARYAMAGARVTGIDLTPRHAELANMHLKALGLSGRAFVGDAESLRFADRSFDRVCSNGVLHHTPRIDGALREVHRVLRPGGDARVIVYNRRSLHYWLNQVLWEGVWRWRLLREGSMSAVLSHGVEYSRIGARPFVRVFAPRQMRTLMRQAGFAAVTTKVRHFRAEDAFPTAVLQRWIRVLRDPTVLERIGRIAGWYVVARGIRPS